MAAKPKKPKKNATKERRRKKAAASETTPEPSAPPTQQDVDEKLKKLEKLRRQAKKAQRKAQKRDDDEEPEVEEREPNRMGRPPAGTPDWTGDFLAAIRTGMSVREAAKAARVDGSLPYVRRDEDDVFRTAWNKAGKVGTRMMEMEADRRAFHGTLEPVYYMGGVVGHIRKYSDALVMFLLRARRPKKYRENIKLEGSGENGAIPIEMSEKDRSLLLENMAAKLAAIAESKKTTEETAHDAPDQGTVAGSAAGGAAVGSAGVPESADGAGDGSGPPVD